MLARFFSIFSHLQPMFSRSCVAVRKNIDFGPFGDQFSRFREGLGEVLACFFDGVFVRGHDVVR